MVANAWAAGYGIKLSSAEDALCLLRHGQRIFVGSACGEPQCLTRALSQRIGSFCDLEIMSLLTLPDSPLDHAVSKFGNESLTGRLFCPGTKEKAGTSSVVPVNLSVLNRLIKDRLFHIDLALIQVSPPDEAGRMSLGVSVDITLAAAQAADMVIAQVNPRMPRTSGEGFLHLDQAAKIVEYEEDLLTWESPSRVLEGEAIAAHLARLVDDASTLHIGLGTCGAYLIKALGNKNDLGLHTGFINNEIMELFKAGSINNSRKTLDRGKIVAAGAMGSRELYFFMNENPCLDMRSFDYVLSPSVIAGQKRLVSLCEVAAVDLAGRISFNYEKGFRVDCDLANFLRLAPETPGGKSIVILPSTSGGGKKSNILSRLETRDVFLPMADTHFVITEFGAVNLFGKNLQERAVALIGIAHPSFRDELLAEAREMELIRHEPHTKDPICGLYPASLEEVRNIEGNSVLFRPAGASDERLIQEHFYAMDSDDVVARFLHEKLVFPRKDVCCICRIDYLRDMTILAVTGEPGFEKILGIGASFFQPETQTSEVAFSVLKEWQGKRIGSILIRKLAQSAIAGGAKGIFAFTIAQNQRMIRLFKGLPYRMKKSVVEGMLALSCRFEDKKEA